MLIEGKWWKVLQALINGKEEHEELCTVSQQAMPAKHRLSNMSTLARFWQPFRIQQLWFYRSSLQRPDLLLHVGVRLHLQQRWQEEDRAFWEVEQLPGDAEM